MGGQGRRIAMAMSLRSRWTIQLSSRPAWDTSKNLPKKKKKAKHFSGVPEKGAWPSL